MKNIIIKKILETALKTPWINSKVDRVRRFYWNKIFFPKFMTSINEHFAISEYFDLNYSVSQSPVKGLMNSIFDPTVPFFDTKDLAVAINISINGFCNEEYIDNDKIIDSANFICESLKKDIYKDNIIKEYLSKVDKDIQNFKYIVERSEIETILSNKALIFQTYFQKLYIIKQKINLG